MNTLIYWTYPEGKRKPVLKMTRLIKKLGRLMPLLLLWRRSKSATCPSNVTSSTSASTQLDTFSGSSSASTYNVEVGPVSSALYFMYYLPYSTAFVKLNSDGTKVWSKSVNFLTLVRSFAVDNTENSVYFIKKSNVPMIVGRLKTSDGTLIDAQSQ